MRAPRRVCGLPPELFSGARVVLEACAGGGGGLELGDPHFNFKKIGKMEIKSAINKEIKIEHKIMKSEMKTKNLFVEKNE